MQKRLAKMNTTSNSISKIPPPTPSPHSTDEHYPTIEEMKKVCRFIFFTYFSNFSF